MGEHSLPLVVDLRTHKLADFDGLGVTEIPPLVLGDQVQCTLKTLDRDGTRQFERHLNVRSIRASLGKTLEPPTSGAFTIGGTVTLLGVVLSTDVVALGIEWVYEPEPDVEAPSIGATVRDESGNLGTVLEVNDYGSSFGIVVANGDAFEPSIGSAISRVTVSAEIASGATAEAFTTAVGAALGTLSNVTLSAAGCWVFQATDDPQVVKNRLRPVSFVRIREWLENGETWREIRLIQAPLAFSGAHSNVLPEGPSIEEIRAGGSESSNDDIEVNEIQALTVPSDFRGTYTLTFDFRETRLLGIEDGIEEIEAALNAMWPDGTKRFSVTNPEPDRAHIEFVGPLRDTDQENIVATVKTSEPGVLTFMLDLATAELATALRGLAEITVPLEIELEIVGDNEDAEDPDVPGRLVTVFQQAVKVVREQIWEELSTVQAIDWMNPPQPRDYRPFTPDQIITGTQHYTAAFGNGVLRSFAFDHNLATAAMHVTVRENAANGRMLAPFEYNARFPSENQTVLEFPTTLPPPALNALAVTLSTAGPISAFQAHTHTIAQVVGLQDALNLLGARISAIELLLPSGVTPTESLPTGTALEIVLPERAEVFPGRFVASFNAAEAIKSGASLPSRGAGLLPAIHDATAANVSLPLGDPAGSAGEVFLNNTSGEIALPGGLGRKTQMVKPNGFLGSDGRVWYRVTHDGTTKSYFPTDFERELFMIFVNDKQLRAGRTFKAEFDLTVAALKAETRAQYLIVIEIGAAPSQTTPATTGTNLEDITWIETPLLSQRLILSGVPMKHHFGCAVARSGAGVLSASRLLYDAWEGGAQVPAAANFAVRGRLIQFDTENSVAGARGFVGYQLSNGTAKIS